MSVSSYDILNLDNGYFTLTDRVTKSNATSAVTYKGNFSITGVTGLGTSLTGTAGNVTQSTSITLISFETEFKY